MGFNTDWKLKADIVRLVAPDGKITYTRKPGSNKPIRSGKGKGDKLATGGFPSAGISSPFTEVEDSREYTPITIYDVTGLVALTFDVATKITMTDAGGDAAVFDYEQPIA